MRAELAEATAWAERGHEVALGQWKLTGPGLVPKLPGWPAAPSREPQEKVVALGPAQFDAHSGRLLRLYGMDVDGPRLELWRAPTDNDRSSARGSFELRPSGGDQWRRRARTIVGATLAGARPGSTGAPAGSDLPRP